MAVTIDDTAAAVLRTVTGFEVEVRSLDGTLLGKFTPAPRPGMSFPELGITDEELDRERNDPNTKWVTADEVDAFMRNLRGVN